jgi:hypothetical protein
MLLMDRATKHTLFSLFCISLAALACNVASNTQPPTLVPRATETPLPTIAYATLSPAELPPQSAPRVAADAALANVFNRVEADRLFLHIDALMNFRTRHVNSPNGVDGMGIGSAFNYIQSQFQEIASLPGSNLYVFPDGHKFNLNWAGLETEQRNAVAFIQGQEIGAGTILIGAHYDSISLNPEDGLAYAPGADDNASGVAALIELARILSTSRHKSSILFVAFSAEEVGRQGSAAFIRDYIQAQGIQLNAMISLDIIGSQTGPNGAVDDRHIRVFSAGPNESTSRQVARAIRLLGYNLMPSMEVIVHDAIDRDGRYSDHMSFSDVGYPAVRFIESLEEPNRHHTERDTIDDVHASYLTRSTQLMLAIITAMADGPRPPQNMSLRDSGNGLRTLVWEPTAGAVSYVVALRHPSSLVFDEQFEITDTSVQWDGFVASRFAGLAIAARDANGLMGAPSVEYAIP